MPIVQVTLTEGRSPETIRSMISAVTQAMVDTGVAPKD
ncbi:tautomerase family protein, partial [Raoultella terrigena]